MLMHVYFFFAPALDILHNSLVTLIHSLTCTETAQRKRFCILLRVNPLSLALTPLEACLAELRTKLCKISEGKG